ncbi:retrovirus-related pol polyprotein from transposon TNT 1-94, partial [Tanacetum coccineum]
RKPALNFMRPFGCHVIILNTLDHLGKFDGKSDDGIFIGYSINSKAFRVLIGCSLMFTHLGGSTPVNAATPSNSDYLTDPLMPDLEDTANL